jgi:anti-sigma regulatory factor (Ser/Thr protein kinase)
MARAGLAAAETPRLARMRDDLALLTTEIVSNAVRHAGMQEDREIVVRVTDGERIHVEVLDEGPGFDRPTAWSGVDTTHGWGLQLVDRLADAWGVERDGPWNKVWSELGSRPGA